MSETDRWELSYLDIFMIWARAWKQTGYGWIHCVPGHLVCVLSRRGKWVLESRQTSEQLSAEGNLILMPDWAQSPLCGRREKGFLAHLAPSLILTKYLLCITWHALHPTLIFPGQVWTVWGDLCSIWLDSGHAPLSRPRAAVSGILPYEKLAPLSLNLQCASGSHVSL